MSNSPVALSSRLRVSVFQAGGALLRASKVNDDGTARYEGVPVFRSGTFRDNLGYQHTYEPEHIDQMVTNHRNLVERGIFPSPPVRADHSMSIKDTIGYATAVRSSVSGSYNYLLADFDITEPDQAGKIDRGTYRFRSAEIGYYETNEEALYWPVFMGFAFVDIPAVEGLDSYAGDLQTTHFSMYVPDSDKTKEPTVDPKDNPPHQFSLPAADGSTFQTSDYAAVQRALDAAATPPAPAVVSFRVNGSDTADAAAVQRHIDVLENFRTESEKIGKNGFIDALVKDGKILATQVDDFKKYVAPMDAEAFAGFRKLHESAPANPLFANHQTGVGPGGGTPAPAGEPTEVDNLAESLTLLRASGLTEAQVEATDTYKRHQALTTGK
jgi:hypothetical protein